MIISQKTKGELKAHRLALGLTCRHAARWFHIDEATYRRWEAGKTANALTLTPQVLARFLTSTRSNHINNRNLTFRNTLEIIADLIEKESPERQEKIYKALEQAVVNALLGEQDV